MLRASPEAVSSSRDALDILKDVYDLPSRADVLQRALAIALVASQHADTDGNIHFLTVGRDGKTPKEVIMSQRF